MKKRLFLVLMLCLCFGFYSCHREIPQIQFVKNQYYKKAESFLYQQNDSAFYYFNKVAVSSKDSLQIAMAYNQMAAIQSDAGDHFGSQESLLASLKFLNDQKERDHRCLSSDYNELGMASIYLSDYDAAIVYFDKASRFSSNPQFRGIIQNNRAVTYQKKKEYTKALQLYQEAISQLEPVGKEYARILSNMAITKWQQHPNYNAVPELSKALKIRRNLKDLFGQNASYIDLSDYYIRSNPDSALLYSGELYKVATRISSPGDRLNALSKLIRLSPPQAVKTYFLKYQQLSDSLQTARSTAKNQFALIRYEAEKNKADNLKLQKDNTEKRYQIIKQSALFYSTLFLLISGTVIALLWYRKRKERMAMEKEQAVKEIELKTSKKIHDVVANGLYRIMTEIEYQQSFDKEDLLDKIEVVYEQSRDISYEKPKIVNQTFYHELETMLLSFSSKKIRVAIVGNDEYLWQKVNGSTLHELEQILQELMVNMKKHSRATAVLIKFEKQEEHIVIEYTDDGIGFSQKINYGNGLTNTGTRINAIAGSISFDTNPGEGLNISISFPIA